jgi:hypothetical protein
MRRGAPCAVVSPCRCLVTPVVRPSRQCPSVRSAELSWLRIDQVASDRWSLRTAPSGRASLLAGSAGAPAMPSLAGPRPPLGVHPSGSHGRGPVVQPSGVQPSNVQLSGVRSAGSVVRGPTVRPAGVRPPGPLLVGGSPAVAVGITSGGGQPCGRDGSGCRWSAGPERLGRRPESAWRGRCCGGRPVGERRSRTWPGRARAQAATVLDRWPAGRPAWREGRRSLPASGRGWHLAWGMTTLRGRCGA